MKKLLLAGVTALLMASAAHAQREGGNYMGGFFGPVPGTPRAGPYRAINQSPVTGRTYSTEADYPTPKVVTKRQMKKRR
jgi:hypothetical protein